MVDDLQSLDYTFNGWNPNLQVSRAGEGHARTLPYVAVDFIATSAKKFESLGDIVGRVDDHRFEYAYCELELVTISIYAEKYHNNGNIRGRDFAYATATKIRTRILAFWFEEILHKYNASIERGMDIPIKDLTLHRADVKTRVHELEIDVYLRTDVRWYKERIDDTIIDERAEKAYVLLKNNNNEGNIRVIFNG